MNTSSASHTRWRCARAAVLMGCVLLGAWLSGLLPARASTVFEVTTNLDGPDSTPGDGVCVDASLGACSLRAAIMEANALPGDDTIVVRADVYELTVLGQFEDNAATGDLDITSNIVVNGAGRDTTFVDGNAADTVFDVRPGATARLEDITVRNGSGGGYPGGVGNRGNLEIVDSFVTNNRNEVNGGGIINSAGATLTLNNTEVRANSSGANGGGVYSRGTLRMIGSAVIGNNAALRGGGVANNGGVVELYRSSVNENRSTGDGGGIWNDNTLSLTQSFIVANLSTVDPSYGGGLFNTGAATIGGSVVSGNQTRRGGGNIFNVGSLLVTDSEVSGGRAGTGGGISHGGDPALSNELRLTNVTLSGNAAEAGGGLYNNNPDRNTVGLTNVTVADNVGALDGSGIYNAAGGITPRNTIVAGNSGGANCFGAIASGGNNLDSANSCGFTGAGDLVNADPRLAPLAANGNSQPGRTHALLAASPAIDACGATAFPSTDQRLRPRPQDGNGDGIAVCDIGAFEVEATAASPPPSAPPSPPAPPPSPAPSAPPAARRTYLPLAVTERPRINE